MRRKENKVMIGIEKSWIGGDDVITSLSRKENPDDQIILLTHDDGQILGFHKTEDAVRGAIFSSSILYFN